MTKKNSLVVKSAVLGVLTLGIVFGALAQASAYPTMSPNPSDPKTCLACHPGGAPGTEAPATATPAPTTPASTTPAPATKPPLVSAPYPPAGPNVVWTLFLAPYSGWDSAWDDISTTQKAPLTNSWDDAWK